MRKLLLAVLLLPIILGGCTEMMVGTHYFKKMANANESAPYSAPPVDVSKRKIGRPYTIMGKTYYPIPSSDGYRTKGIASWYGKEFHGKKTANGERYNMYHMTAAHPTLPLPTFVRVTNLNNGRSIIVRVNDRGPFLRGRVIDLSYRAAVELDMAVAGTAPVLLEALPTNGSALRPFRKDYIPQTVAKSKERLPSLPKVSTPPVQVETPVASVVRPEIAEESTLADEDKTIIGDVKIYVQTGAFTEYENAEKQIKNVEKYYNNVDVEEVHINGRTFHRVRVGPLQNVGIADAVLARLASAGFNVARIVVD